jgi:hypothetical protein
MKASEILSECKTAVVGFFSDICGLGSCIARAPEKREPQDLFDPRHARSCRVGIDSTGLPSEISVVIFAQLRKEDRWTKEFAEAVGRTIEPVQDIEKLRQLCFDYNNSRLKLNPATRPEEHVLEKSKIEKRFRECRDIRALKTEARFYCQWYYSAKKQAEEERRKVIVSLASPLEDIPWTPEESETTAAKASLETSM